MSSKKDDTKPDYLPFMLNSSLRRKIGKRMKTHKIEPLFKNWTVEDWAFSDKDGQPFAHTVFMAGLLPAEFCYWEIKIADGRTMGELANEQKHANKKFRQDRLLDGDALSKRLALLEEEHNVEKKRIKSVTSDKSITDKETARLQCVLKLQKIDSEIEDIRKALMMYTLGSLENKTKEKYEDYSNDEI